MEYGNPEHLVEKLEPDEPDMDMAHAGLEDEPERDKHFEAEEVEKTEEQAAAAVAGDSETKGSKEGRQQSLFKDDRQHDRMNTLEAQIRHKYSDIRGKIKECDAYMKLLKDGPKTVFDIFFRCHQSDLSVDHLGLLKTQAYQLGALLADIQSDMQTVRDWEHEVEPLRRKFGYHKNEETGEVEYVPGSAERETDQGEEHEAPFTGEQAAQEAAGLLGVDLPAGNPDNVVELPTRADIDGPPDREDI